MKKKERIFITVITIMSFILIYTCMTIFFVFLPAIISGYNIYLTTLIVFIFITLMTLLIVQGPNKKAVAAGLGSIGGLMVG